MGYSPHWVEKHLGITYSAQLQYEKKKLIDANTYRKANDYREYSDADVQTIWKIKMLQGVGFSLNDIKRILQDKSFDWSDMLDAKISELKLSLGYARTLKLIGVLPSLPDDFASRDIDELRKTMEILCNITILPGGEEWLHVVEVAEKIPAEGSTDEDVAKLTTAATSFFKDEQEIETMLHLGAYTSYISELKNMDYKAEHPQAAAGAMFDYYKKAIGPFVKRAFDIDVDAAPEMTPREFALSFVPSCILGGSGKITRNRIGEDGALFVANTLAYFGGYDSAEDLMRKEFT